MELLWTERATTALTGSHAPCSTVAVRGESTTRRRPAPAACRPPHPPTARRPGPAAAAAFPGGSAGLPSFKGKFGGSERSCGAESLLWVTRWSVRKFAASTSPANHRVQQRPSRLSPPSIATQESRFRLILHAGRTRTCQAFPKISTPEVHCSWHSLFSF